MEGMRKKQGVCGGGRGCHQTVACVSEFVRTYKRITKDLKCENQKESKRVMAKNVNQDKI
jgi:hypothetical protein